MPYNVISAESGEITNFDDVEYRLMSGSVRNYHNWIVSQLQQPLVKAFGFAHSDVLVIIKDTEDLLDIFNSTLTISISKYNLSIMRTALLLNRQQEMEDITRRIRFAKDPTIIAELEQRVQKYDQLLNNSIFNDIPIHNLPNISDYMAIPKAEEILFEYEDPIQERKLDDKFGILNSPDLFIPDLDYYRNMCALRNAPLSIAYIDVDDFKKFNTKYTETLVDQHLLPNLMSAIESHMYCHGYAYRYGGDEYVMLMPNRNIEQAKVHLQEFQTRISKLEYHLIVKKPTVSIGIIEIDKSTYLTNHEIEKLAVEAKNQAKANGRNSIAYFIQGSVDPSKIEILEK